MFILGAALVSGREAAGATLLDLSGTTRRARLFQSHSASTIVAAGVFADQFNTGAI
jgi:hypothetical protein